MRREDRFDNESNESETPSNQPFTTVLPVRGGYGVRFVERNNSTGRSTVSYWGADGFVARELNNIGAPFQSEGQAYQTLPDLDNDRRSGRSRSFNRRR
jgi:hypothetical protein